MPDGPHESPFGQPLLSPPSRWGEVNKLMPILFVVGTISMLYVIYVVAHCMPLMASENEDVRIRGFVECLGINIITFMLLLCYAMCTLVHPGEVPQEWVYHPNMEPAIDLPIKEVKKKGGVPRHCKKCGKYKPDRCHHCRVCGTCILKMDHHCPWINNCVGYHNYKYFLLLLFYTMLATHLIFWTISESMMAALNKDAPFFNMFSVLFGLSISFFLAFLVTPFLGLHIWLVSQGLSTIEFCEQVLPQGGASCWCCMETNSMWNLGVFRNFQAVLGDNPLFWLMPFSMPRGTGLAYEPNPRFFAHLAGPGGLPRDLEATRGSHKQGSSRKLLAVPSKGYGALPSDGLNALQHHYQRQPYCVPEPFAVKD